MNRSETPDIRHSTSNIPHYFKTQSPKTLNPHDYSNILAVKLAAADCFFFLCSELDVKTFRAKQPGKIIPVTGYEFHFKNISNE
jgi:hypothetical protein